MVIKPIFYIWKQINKLRMIIHERGGIMFGFKKKEYEVVAVTDGTVIEMEKVNDPVFAQKMLGDGFAIKTMSDYVCAPFDGEIVMTFPSKHAVGITAKDGLELLIHIGIGTVNEEGKGFSCEVEMGQQVKKGDLLVQFNREDLDAKGYDMTTVLIFTNSDTYKSFAIEKGKEVVGGQDTAGVYKK